MSARHPAQVFDEVAQKWRALADRRRAYFIELYESGRWRHYYSEKQFIERLREAIWLSQRWAEIAPSPADEVFAEQVQTAIDAHRTAA
jgi:uncharacterized repeat protein (TIGR03809 family)